jgi:hypothetical protein
MNFFIDQKRMSCFIYVRRSVRLGEISMARPVTSKRACARVIHFGIDTETGARCVVDIHEVTADTISECARALYGLARRMARHPDLDYAILTDCEAVQMRGYVCSKGYFKTKGEGGKLKTLIRAINQLYV